MIPTDVLYADGLPYIVRFPNDEVYKLHNCYNFNECNLELDIDIIQEIFNNILEPEVVYNVMMDYDVDRYGLQFLVEPSNMSNDSSYFAIRLNDEIFGRFHSIPLNELKIAVILFRNFGETIGGEMK